MSKQERHSQHWSPQLQGRTVDTLRSLPFEAFMNGNQVHLKHWDGRFGAISLSDAMANQMRVVVRESDAIEEFDTPEDLVENGWAID